MKVSVIVPVYNVEQYLDRCMASLLVQTCSDREIILVDDGSTDSSGKMCDAYADRLGIRVVHQENGGLGSARNSGIYAAKGEYLLFLDPDDYFGPEFLQNLCEAAERTKADLVVGGFTIVGPDGQKEPRPLPHERVFRTPEERKELLFHIVGAPPEDPLDSRYGVTACGRLYRRSVVKAGELRFPSERQLISEDLIFNMDFLGQADSAAVITDASYFYCTNAGSLSKRHREDRFAQDCVLYRAVKERLPPCAEEEYQLCLHRLLISRARYDIIQETDYRDLVDHAYPLREKIAEILRTPELRTALDHYPWRRLPRMQGIFAWYMKRQRVRSILALIRLKRWLLSGR